MWNSATLKQFNLLRILTLSHKPLCTGVQPKLKHSNTQLRWPQHKSNLRYQGKGYMKEKYYFHSVHSSYTRKKNTRKNPVHMLSFSSFLYPRKVCSCVISNSDGWSWPGYIYANELSNYAVLSALCTALQICEITQYKRELWASPKIIQIGAKMLCKALHFVNTCIICTACFQFQD